MEVGTLIATGNGYDSDNDVITDFLNSNNEQGSTHRSARAETSLEGPSTATTTTTTSNNNAELENGNIRQNKNNNHHINMIPIINVTPHSPASTSRYQNLFEDSLTQLQSIRESVVQMKNSSPQMHDGVSGYGVFSSAALSTSLPDLTANTNGVVSATNVGLAGSSNHQHGCHFAMWSPQQHLYLLNADRRISWTAIDDLIAAECTNKSVSLSSLDSEEQETIRVADQRRRTARNSAGGISTHSLNEAELARDFERIAVKRNLATELISRIPLQKSISTSSIVAKEELKTLARHLTDSEDENQGLLRAHAKIEVFDNAEKRRKRGSLFFRKKKDKAKIKTIGQVSVCDVCGMAVTMTSFKEHHSDCKGRKYANQKISLSTGGGLGGKKLGDAGHDYYDGQDHPGHYADDAPLLRSEFLNEPPIEARDLGADPALGIELEEHDSWTPSVPPEVVKELQGDKLVKRQEHIYEFIMTEKHYCETLLVIQKVFVERIERYFPAINVKKMFPRLNELTELHTDFLRKLRHKQRENYVVNSIADILLDFFSIEKTQHLRLAYGEFCVNYRAALEKFKALDRDQAFLDWYKHCLSNPLLKKKGIPECILFVTQRLFKYPLLIEALQKTAGKDQMEIEKLQHALNVIKNLLNDVNACVAEKELRKRQIEIFERLDPKSFAIYRNKPFRKADIGVDSHRRLKFEGYATLMQGRSKMQCVQVVVFTDCLCFMTENSAHNRYAFFTPEHKAGVVPLQKLLIREKAGTECRAIYIISSNPAYPEMYELKVQQPKDKNIWIKSIRQSVLECPSSDSLEVEDLTVEEKLRIGVNKREIIEKLRQKDIEHALLLEEKVILQLNLLKQPKYFSDPALVPTAANATLEGSAVVSAVTFLSSLGSYKNLVSNDCDASELWKRVLNNVQNICQLASTLYTAATGLPVSRSVSSVGEKQSDNYSSPTLPKRAETFAGFDEKRAKNIFPCRDVPKLPTTQIMTARLQELEEKPRDKTSSMASSLQVSNSSDQNTSSLAAGINQDQSTLKEHSAAALQITHSLQMLLSILSQQMTTIQSLQQQLALYRENPRAVYTHNDQLEELRNLQDKLQEEKIAWSRQREIEQQELDEKRAKLIKMQAEIKSEQEDIRQQRDQLYRKMELLSSQGLLLSPNTPLPMVSGGGGMSGFVSSDDHHDTHDHSQNSSEGHQSAGTSGSSSSIVDRRKDKWRTASTISKTPPVNLLSATNAPKASQASVKQKIPMKLSSLSSSTSIASPLSSPLTTSRIDKSASFNSSGMAGVGTGTGTGGLIQMLPFKLADKRLTIQQQQQQQPVPQHSRTGSSPAIIQHQTSSASTPPPLGKVVQRHESVSTFSSDQRYIATPTSRQNLTKTVTPIDRNAKLNTDEEEIYF